MFLYNKMQWPSVEDPVSDVSEPEDEDLLDLFGESSDEEECLEVEPLFEPLCNLNRPT